jgi:hypothetical protein
MEGVGEQLEPEGRKRMIETGAAKGKGRMWSLKVTINGGEAEAPSIFSKDAKDRFP